MQDSRTDDLRFPADHTTETSKGVERHMKHRYSLRKKKTRKKVSTSEESQCCPAVRGYGTAGTICSNTDCELRKNKPCSGYEGCPGFQSR
jgi:hypothetical protein